MRWAAFTICAALAAALAGCKDVNVPDASKTGLPGMVAAGGRTSGEVMAASTRPKASNQPPAGTPGIPAGAGGNVGGTAPGGMAASAVAAGTASAPASAASAPASAPAAQASAAAFAPSAAASAPAPTPAQLEAKQLAASIDATATRWRERAGQNGWAMHPPTSIETASAVAAQAQPQAAQAPAAGASAPIRSEKQGTAPASSDVKTGVNVQPPGVRADSPDKAGH